MCIRDRLNLGLILTAVGIVYFKNPNHFAFGGTSGLSILLDLDMHGICASTGSACNSEMCIRDRIRTGDLILTKDALYQLSYSSCLLYTSRQAVSGIRNLLRCRSSST